MRLRAATTKTRRALWVELHPALADALEATLAARARIRDPEARLFADSRRRRAPHVDREGVQGRRDPALVAARPAPPADPLLHLRGVPVGADRRVRRAAQPAVTANTYTHVLIDEAELDYAALARTVRNV